MLTGRGRWFKPILIVGVVMAVAVPLGVVALRQTASVADSAHGTTTGVASSAGSDSWATLLALSTNLGPAKTVSVDVLVTLRSSDRPVALERWARLITSR